jgi:pimeloyl-ACP methyl ester carboxylesterase
MWTSGQAQENPMTNPSSITAVQGFVSDFAEVNGVRLHYLVGGNPDGPPVLLWHGFLGTGRVWRKVMAALANAGLAVLVPDMRGYGDSDKPEGSAGYDARALADEFRGLAHTIGFGGGRPLVLVGFDMGAPPALLWAADHPDEVAGLVYIEESVMLLEVLSGILAYTPETMKEGSMWWWILPLAPGVPERLVVGHERQFLTWFYDRAMVRRDAIGQGDLDETMRTFAGREGVLGAMGVYRAGFTTMDQTQPLKAAKVRVPVVALGGDHALGALVRQQVELVAEHVSGSSIPGCGHFMPEEHPTRSCATCWP